MIKFFRKSFKSLLAIALVFTLGACSTGGAAGLEPFKSQDGQYGFLFPTGWTRMAGRMGSDNVTVKNLEIVDIDNKNNLLFIKGAIPGANNSPVFLLKKWRLNH